MIFCIGCSERGMMHVRIDYAGCASQRIVNDAASRQPAGFRSGIAASFWPRAHALTVINTEIGGSVPVPGEPPQRVPDRASPGPKPGTFRIGICLNAPDLRAHAAPTRGRRKEADEVLLLQLLLLQM
jgi:hypothetical protein